MSEDMPQVVNFKIATAISYNTSHEILKNEQTMYISYWAIYRICCHNTIYHDSLTSWWYIILSNAVEPFLTGLSKSRDLQGDVLYRMHTTTIILEIVF